MNLSNDPTRRALVLGGVSAIGVIAAAFAVLRLAPFGVGVGPLPPLRAVEAPAAGVSIDRTAALDHLFDSIGYAPLRNGHTAKVPPVLVRALPRGFEKDGDEAARKRRFIRLLVPIVLRVNHTIERQRGTLERLARRIEQGRRLSAREWRWLGLLAEHYRTKPDDWRTLRLRVAPISPSLVVAQAAVESGWGSSRFALHGNALFGQWSYSGKGGLKPRRRDEGKSHTVKTYHRLIDSVWDYARNLNTHRAYRELRRLRAAGHTDGRRLAAGLGRYSQKRGTYVALIRRIIAENRLSVLDRLSLAEKPPQGI